MTRTTPPARTHFRVWRTIATRWSDNDVYGHVNNCIYYHWFDSAVNGWLIGNGLLDAAAGNPIGLVAATRCQYFAPLSFPGDVDVGLALAELGQSSVRYALGVFAHGAADAAAAGEFTHVAVDRETRRPVPLPQLWRTALQAIA